jgi:isopentenyldiphosphate isomerase
VAGLLVKHLLLASAPWREDAPRDPSPPARGTRHDRGPRILVQVPYQAQYDAQCAEHELCWVYTGRTRERPRANVHEIAAWRYVTPDELQAEIAHTPEIFTPWFKIEWARIARPTSSPR